MKSKVIEQPNPNDTVIVEMTRAEAQLLRTYTGATSLNSIKELLGDREGLDFVAINEAQYALYKALAVAL